MRLNFRKLSTAKKIFISLLLCLLLLVVGLVIIINFYILVINIPLKGNYAQINIENGSINIFIPKGDSTWIYLHNLNHPDTITPTETTLHQNMTFIQIIPIHQNQPSIVGSQTTSLPTAKKTYIQDMSHWQTYTTSQFYFQYPPGWQVLSGSEYTVFDPRSVHRIFNKYANSWATGYDHQMTVKVENTRYFDKVYTPEGYVKFICTTFNSQARLSINETDQEGKKVFRAICSSPAEINNYIYNDNVLLQVYTLYESPEIANKFLSSIIITSP